MTTELLEEIRRQGAVMDAEGTRYPLSMEIDAPEERFIRDLISGDQSIRRTLEVGLGYGISALTICGATRGRDGARHVALDPYQRQIFHDIGILNLERAGIDFAEHIPGRSELEMPRLIAEGVEPFDLLFIDGLHSFEQTLMDLAFGLRLLRVGGYVVIDDCRMRGVQKALSYIANFPSVSVFAQVDDGAAGFGGMKHRLRVALWSALPAWTGGWLPKRAYDGLDRGRWARMVALRKDARDDRPMEWFRPF